MNRKEACKALSFILIFVLLLTGVSYIVRTNGDVKDRFAGFYAEKKNSIDVMMFGGSTVATSFSPGYMWGEYGFTSYPLSSNTQRPKAIRYLLEEAYKTQTPELIVVELRMFTYEDEVLAQDEPHIREVVDNMRYSQHRIKAVSALTDGVEGFDDKLSYYFDIIKYHSNWGMFFDIKELQKVTYRKADLHKGFEHPEEILCHNPEYDTYHKTEDIIPIPVEQETILRDLFSFLKENKQDALFVVAPCTFKEEYYAQMNYMKDIIEQEGFQYLNVHDVVDYDCTTEYLDGGHSNILGAKKCSEALGEYIINRYALPDKRDEDGYESWNDSYKAFCDVYIEVNENRDRYIVYGK
ncbi:MAG: SGNH/GDSL hydrolase family protein [Lachnospiraceae bacterium]|nr:SGNH/GDSL hydrolase family protein [Lachnospiraceae bacterium]